MAKKKKQVKVKTMESDLIRFWSNAKKYLKKAADESVILAKQGVNHVNCRTV